MPLSFRSKTTLRKMTPGGVGSTSSYGPLALGGAYQDRYRKNPQLTSRQLIGEFVGLAFACMSVRAEALASTPLRLFSHTSPKRKSIPWIDAYESHYKSPCTWPLSVNRKEFLRKMSNTFDIGPAGKMSGIGVPGLAANANVKEVADHPLLELLANPETVKDGEFGLTGYDHKYMTQVYLDMFGRAYWYVQRDGTGRPMNLWLLRSHFVKEVPDFTGSSLISYYEYGGPSGERYAPKDVIKFTQPDPYNPNINGYGVMQAAMEKVGLDREGDAQASALYENAGVPGIIASPIPDDSGSYVSPQEARRMQTALNNSWRQDKNGASFVSPYPMKFEPLSFKPTEILDAKRRGQIRTEILFIFRIPEAYAALNSANLASALTAETQFSKECVIPMSRRIASPINRQLLPMYGEAGKGLFMAFDNPIPDDKVFALEQTRVAADNGMVEIDEGRVALSLEPYNDARGKVRLVAAGLVALDKVTGEPPPLNQPGTSVAASQSTSPTPPGNSVSDVAPKAVNGERFEAMQKRMNGHMNGSANGHTASALLERIGRWVAENPDEAEEQFGDS